MAVTYSTAAKNARLTAVVGEIDGAAASPANGRLEIGTAGMASILATITLALPCGTVAGGVLTFSGTPLSDASADNGGTAAAARIRDAAGTDVVTGLTVGTAASPSPDIVLDNTAISAGQTVTINSATITHG